MILIDNNFTETLTQQLIGLIEKHQGQVLQYDNYFNVAFNRISIAIINQQSYNKHQLPGFYDEMCEERLPAVNQQWLFASIINRQIQDYKPFHIKIESPNRKKRPRRYTNDDNYPTPHTKKQKLDALITQPMINTQISLYEIAMLRPRSRHGNRERRAKKNIQRQNESNSSSTTTNTSICLYIRFCKISCFAWFIKQETH